MRTSETSRRNAPPPRRLTYTRRPPGRADVVEARPGRATSWAARLLRLRAPLLLLTHAVVFVVVYALAYELRFDFALPTGVAETLARALPTVVALKLAVFIATGSHRGWWRYATFADVTALAESATLATAVVVVTTTTLGFRPGPDLAPMPRSVLALDWAGTVLVLGGLRGSTRLFRERYYPMIAARPVERVLLVGASDSVVTLAAEIQARPGLGMKVVGLLDPDDALHGRTLGGVDVLGHPRDVARHAEREGAVTVLVPSQPGSGREVRALVEACGRAALRVQVVPPLDAVLHGALTFQPRDVDIHDLLARDPVRLDGASVGRFLRGRTVLVTGAAGSIGSELCRQILTFRPARLVLLDHSENGLFFVERELAGRCGETRLSSRLATVTDARRVRAALAEFAPDVVFHAAAHKHVPLMEANPGEAIKNNVLGTKVVVDEAVRAGVEVFVLVSTDKAVNPTSVMGACKRVAEMYVQALSDLTPTRMLTVRFGNVLGSNGSVVPVFREQIRAGGPVTVTHPEMTRYFMTIPEAAQLVLQAGAIGRGGEIFVLDMGEAVKVVDLARDMIRLSGLVEGREIDIVFTGLRPGEKLYEELYDDRETRLPTSHPKIFTARHRPGSIAFVRGLLDDLAAVVDRPPHEVVAALRTVVAEYRPGPGQFAVTTANDPRKLVDAAS